jgi:hypothetical protein
MPVFYVFLRFTASLFAQTGGNAAVAMVNTAEIR